MFLNSWQNILLSAVIFLALGLLLYSLAQLIKLRRLQSSNANLTWLIIITIILAIVSIHLLYIALVESSTYLLVFNAVLILISSLLVWFAMRASNDIANKLIKSEALEHYYTTHDDLTGLPNLSFFNSQLEKALSLSRREDDEFALLIIGLNRFKIINETLGYFVGDAILQEITRRIRAALRKTDLIARLGGDEFVALINPVAAHGHIHTISNNIAESIQEPLAIEGKPADVGVSIGIALYPKHAKNSVELIEKARNAMIVAEKQGNSVFIYNDTTVDEFTEDIQIVGMLQRAIQEEQLLVLYQPQIRLSDEKIISAEALIRWQHPKYGMLDPGRFVPYAEKAGLIYEINLWLLQKVIMLLMTWHEKGIQIPIAFNITANGFLNKDFQQQLNLYLKNHAWLKGLLKIELTETSSIDNVDEIHAAMLEYKNRGLTFSLDDYGTKHASLEYLQKLPFDELKIDQSFMANAVSDENSQAIIQHAKDIAEQLQLTCTAEGIASQEILAIAKKYNIDNGQGYYFSPAISERKLRQLI